MPFRLDSHSTRRVWPAIVSCRAFLASYDGSLETLGFHEESDHWTFQPDSREATVSVPTTPDADLSAALATADAEARAVFALYLPLLLGSWYARQRGEVFFMAHVAQSLDGRIACTNGQSQWISNEANLHHAHRLRALHDAVLVGRNTVTQDNPQLTVRHVEGAHPRRVLLSASASVLDLPDSHHVFQPPGSLLLCGPGAAAARPSHEHVDVVEAPCNDQGRIAPHAVATALQSRGIRSVFVEGGSEVLSSFLAADAISILHVHVAPMILGSGVSSFSLPPIQHIQEGWHARAEHFDLDGELLFSCQRRHVPTPRTGTYNA